MAFSDHPRLTAPSMSVRFAQDTVSVCGSFTTGSNTALSRRRNESRMRHMPLQSTTLSIDACENGSPTQVIFIQHPQRKLYEVHYAKGVETDEDRRFAELLRTPKGILDWVGVPGFLSMRP